jgi:hypothetical protein
MLFQTDERGAEEFKTRKSRRKMASEALSVVGLPHGI